MSLLLLLRSRGGGILPAPVTETSATPVRGVYDVTKNGGGGHVTRNGNTMYTVELKA
jgi:hypothetical protein